MLTKWDMTRLGAQETGFEASLDYSETLSQKQQKVNLDKNKHKFVTLFYILISKIILWQTILIIAFVVLDILTGINIKIEDVARDLLFRFSVHPLPWQSRMSSKKNKLQCL